MSRLATQAVILRTVDYRESDRIVTLMTRTLGKVSALARGARKSRRRFGGALEPFALFECTLGPGRGSSGMFLLEEATLLDDHPGLARRLESLGVAAYLIELARELLPEYEPEDRAFDLIAESLAQLSAGADYRRVAISTALGLLSALGLEVSLGRCNACGTPVPQGRRVFFDPRRGGVVCTPCGGGPLVLSAKSAACLMQLEHLSLSDAVMLDIPDDALFEIEHALDLFIEHHLEKQLITTHFRRQVKPAGFRPY